MTVRMHGSRPEQDVQVSDHGDGVVVVAFGQDPHMTVLTEALLVKIAGTLEETQQDAHCCVVAGGSRHFAVGSDLRELRLVGPLDYLTSRRRDAWERIHALTVPLVAAVAGFALGGACELALACDLVVASDTARFGQPEPRLGIMPGAGGTQRWTRVVGRHVATDVILGGRVVDAWEAKRLGIASRVVPRERLLACAVETARTVASNGPLSARLSKQAIAAADEVGLRSGLDYERLLFSSLLSTSDRTEGITAFLEKRPPRYEGR